MRQIGRSVQGRPILSLETGNKSKPRAVFSATLQPGEPSAWAILAMAEAAVADQAMEQLLQDYDLAFVPMTNPDGVVNGRGGGQGRRGAARGAGPVEIPGPQAAPGAD